MCPDERCRTHGCQNTPPCQLGAPVHSCVTPPGARLLVNLTEADLRRIVREEIADLTGAC